MKYQIRRTSKQVSAKSRKRHKYKDKIKVEPAIDYNQEAEPLINGLRDQPAFINDLDCLIKKEEEEEAGGGRVIRLKKILSPEISKSGDAKSGHSL